jgi:hypothetical protein
MSKDLIMKKVIASASLVALGAAGVQAAYSPGLTSMDASKNWSVSLSVRGFYDDNYATRDDRKLPPFFKDPVDDSFGVEVRPSLNLNFPLEQTLIRLGYTYSGRYYEGRGEDRWDQTHIADFLIDHAFSPSARVTVTDAFAYSSEPDIINGGAVQRSDHNNLRNQAGINFFYQFSDQFSTVLGYQNTIFDYEQDAGDVGIPSYSGLLDRMEHLIIANLRWQALPQTVLVLGYNYGMVDYTGDEFITPFFTSDDRDSTSHYIYGGVDQTFTSDLTGSLRLGAQRIEFDSNNVGEGSDWSPYADASLNYSYMAGSSVTVGARHSRTSTDVVRPSGAGDITSDAQSTAGYVNWIHTFFPEFAVNAMATIQHSTFNGGASDDDTEVLVMAGVGLTYQFNQYFAAEAGYNFDKVNSDVAGREFTRNRVYVGLKASY